MGFLASVLLTLLLAPGVPSATVTPTSGPVGSRITVTGTGFDPGPVDIRWGDASGPVLGVTEGPDFTVDVTVPDGPAGTRSVVAVPREGGQTGAPAAFLVEPGGSSPPSGGGGRTDGVVGGLGRGTGGGNDVPAPGRRTTPTASGGRATAPTPGPSSPGPAPAPMDQAGAETPGGTDPPPGSVGGFGATPDDDPVALGRARPATEEAGGGSTPVMLAAAAVLAGLAGAWLRRRRIAPAPDTLWE